MAEGARFVLHELLAPGCPDGPRTAQRPTRGRHGPSEWDAQSAFFFTSPYAALGTHDGVPVPPGCTLPDSESEAAAGWQASDVQ
ncbi:hypothetical protein [Streptomyces sp. NPDC017435]|uniref:hypothetical protein n=1 Tax=Streptomyces sp. NPDC017435 TaxID=3364995 RepID=UPI003796A7E8